MQSACLAAREGNGNWLQVSDNKAEAERKATYDECIPSQLTLYTYSIHSFDKLYHRVVIAKMMSGIVAVGLALAIIPVVVEILDFYSGSLTSRDVSFLAESLKNRELIFKNAVEELLSSILSKEELRGLLRNPRGLMWADDSISRRMDQHLGAEAGDLLEIAKEIHRTVYHLKEKLPVSLLVYNAAIEDKRYRNLKPRNGKTRLTNFAACGECRSQIAPQSQTGDQKLPPWTTEPIQLEEAES